MQLDRITQGRNLESHDDPIYFISLARTTAARSSSLGSVRTFIRAIHDLAATSDVAVLSRMSTALKKMQAL